MASYPASVVAAFAAVALGNGVAQAQTAATSAWSERGMFVYDDFVVDFRRELEGSWLETRPLADCSTGEVYCASGAAFRVVIPRFCQEITVGDEWAEAGVTTMVLGREDHPLSPHRSAEVTWFLGDPAQPGVVYEYEPHNGIVALYRPNNGDFDFVGMAQDGRLTAFKRERMSDWRIRVHYKGLVSFDPAGVCQER